MKRHVVALTVSVVLNMLLAGMLLGDLSSRFVTPASASDNVPMLSQLPADKRALFETILVPAKKKMDGERAQIDDAKKVALHILAAEPFDAVAYMAQIQHINDLHMQMKLQIAAAVVTFAKQLTQDQRVTMADILSRPPFTLLPPTPSKAKNPAAAEQ